MLEGERLGDAHAGPAQDLDDGAEAEPAEIKDPATALAAVERNRREELPYFLGCEKDDLALGELRSPDTRRIQGLDPDGKPAEREKGLQSIDETPDSGGSYAASRKLHLERKDMFLADGAGTDVPEGPDDPEDIVVVGPDRGLSVVSFVGEIRKEVGKKLACGCGPLDLRRGCLPAGGGRGGGVPRAEEKRRRGRLREKHNNGRATNGPFDTKRYTSRCPEEERNSRS